MGLIHQQHKLGSTTKKNRKSINYCSWHIIYTVCLNFTGYQKRLNPSVSIEYVLYTSIDMCFIDSKLPSYTSQSIQVCIYNLLQNTSCTYPLLSMRCKKMFPAPRSWQSSQQRICSVSFSELICWSLCPNYCYGPKYQL